MKKKPTAKPPRANDDRGPLILGPRRVETGDPARDAAFAFIAHQAAKFPRLDLRPFHTPALAGRDAALAHAIVDAVIRRWLTLAWLVSQRCQQPLDALEPPLRGALLAGAAQLAFLDRVPAHAAINHAVEWAKRRIRPGAGAMVNAILRRVADAVRANHPSPLEGDSPTTTRPIYQPEALHHLPLADGTALVLNGLQLPADGLPRTEITTSHPRDLLKAWAARFGQPEAARLALHGIGQPPVILNIGEGAYLPLPPGALTPHTRPGFSVFTGDHDALVTLLNDRDDLWVQDPASAEAVATATTIRPEPRLILDLCAGMGTKTRQLARLLPGSRILATDRDERRLEVLRTSFRGHPRVGIIDPGNLLLEHAGTADLILLDVPCSNTGVLARRPEARYRFSADALEALAAVQRQIIADAIPLLAPRGSILYSTCSLEHAENAGMAQWAVKWHRFGISAERQTLPAGGPGLPAAAYTDGSFSVLLTLK